MIPLDQDPEALKRLGSDTNAIIWPEPSLDEEEELDEVEHPTNQRLMRIGIVLIWFSAFIISMLSLM